MHRLQLLHMEFGHVTHACIRDTCAQAAAHTTLCVCVCVFTAWTLQKHLMQSTRAAVGMAVGLQTGLLRSPSSRSTGNLSCLPAGPSRKPDFSPRKKKAIGVRGNGLSAPVSMTSSRDEWGQCVPQGVGLYGISKPCLPLASDSSSNPTLYSAVKKIEAFVYLADGASGLGGLDG